MYAQLLMMDTMGRTNTHHFQTFVPTLINMLLCSWYVCIDIGMYTQLIFKEGRTNTHTRFNVIHFNGVTESVEYLNSSSYGVS